MKLLALALALILAIQVTHSQALSEDEKLIRDFLGYIDTVNDITYDRSLKKMRNVFQEALNQIPTENRGPLSGALQTFIEHAKRVEHNSSSAEKKAVIEEVQSIMNGGPGPGSLPTQEMMIIGTQLLPGLFAVKSIDDERATKLSRAAAYLRTRLSQEGISRNQQLFNLLEAYEREREDKHLIELLALYGK